MKKFGTLLKDLRNSTKDKITARALAVKLNITPAYLCDIEKGYRYPSKELLDNMVKVLDVNENIKYKIYDSLALEMQKENIVSYDIAKYVMQNKNLRTLIRRAKESNINDSYWDKVINNIEGEINNG